MEEDVKKRIREVLKEYASNPTKLSKQFGVNQKTLNSQINDNTTLSVSTVLLVVEAFPTISTEWLLKGTGDMVRHPDITPADARYMTLGRDIAKVINEFANPGKSAE